jgi:Mg-chelatase subunit ChlD/outer membrane protein OmpA-like peptidoglycan-associated protein
VPLKLEIRVEHAMKYSNGQGFFLSAMVTLFIAASQLASAVVATTPAAPALGKRSVYDLVNSNTAAAHVLEKRNTSSGLEFDIALYDIASGRTIGQYAPPFVSPQEDYRAMWKDYVISTLQIPTHPDDINVLEQRKVENESFAIAFVLDHSPSMTVPRALRMQRAVQHALSLFDANDYVSVVKFTGRVQTEVPLTKEHATFMNGFKVNGLNLRSDGTAIYDGAMAALEQLASAPQDSKRVMIVFTDGEDNSSATSLQQVIDKATASGTQVFAVTYGVANDEPLTQLTSATGGRVTRLNDVYDFDKVFLGMYSSLRHTYRLSIRSREPEAPENIVSAITTVHLSGSGNVHSRDILEMLPKSNVDVPNSAQTQEALVINMDVQYLNDVDISPADVAALDSIATVLIQRRDLALEISNFGENNTNDPDAVTLATRRTQAIRELLIRRGVPSARLHGMGNTRKLNNTSSKKTTLILSKL